MKKILILILLFPALSIRYAHAQELHKLSKNQVSEDIDSLIRNISEIHPDMYHSISKVKLSGKVADMKKHIPDSLTQMQAFGVLSQMAALIGEGHTGIQWPKEILTKLKNGSFEEPAVKVNSYQGKNFNADIQLSSGKLIAGVQLLAINGRSSKELLRQLTGLRGGLLSFKSEVAFKQFPFLLQVIGVSAPFYVTYSDTEGHRLKGQLANVRSAAYDAVFQHQQHLPDYSFKLIDQNTAYLNFRSMSGKLDTFQAFADSVFKALSANNVAHLVIDLRENSGGNSALGDYLLSYFSTKAYRMEGGSELKISRQFIHQMQNPSLRSLYGDKLSKCAGKPIGTIMSEMETDFTQPVEKPYKFRGNVCFLIGPFTFSSANMLAGAVKDYHLATLIGKDTGEPANDYAELCNFKLPNTQLIAFTSTTLWLRPSGNKKEKGPIHPDIIAPASDGPNSALKVAIQYLGKNQ